MSTLKYYAKTNIGSRPSKRSQKSTLDFGDLRAIPFVGSWSQLKQNVPGFYGIYGFVMFTLLILVAKTLRIFIKRPEDYYGKAAVDSEDYPAAQLEQIDHDGA